MDIFRGRSFSASDIDRYIRDQIARNVLEFFQPYPSIRDHQRLLVAKTVYESLSSADPKKFIDFTVDDSIRPKKMDVILRMSKLTNVQMQQYAWNPEDSSSNIYVKSDDPLTFHRLPVAQSTDCIRTKIGFSRGFHVWKIKWPADQRGTHPLLGVATKDAPLQVPGYHSLLGMNMESYGWDIRKKKCYHNSPLMRAWQYPDPRKTDINASSNIPEVIYCILDMDDGWLAFATEEKYLGIAFKGLKGKTVYPAVSAVWGHCEVSIHYLGGIQPVPRSLMDICRRTIRQNTHAKGMNDLDLPSPMKRYLHYLS